MLIDEEPAPNVPLLRKAVAWAREQDARPETESEWYQDDFFNLGTNVGRTCSSVYCIAGYVVATAHDYDTMVRMGAPAVDALATKMLGITHEESCYLYEGDNRLWDVERVAREIAKRAGDEL